MKKSQLKSKKGFRKLSFEEVKLKLRKPLKRSPLRAKNSLKSTLKRGSMTKPIPLKMRAELAEDKFMKECCLQGIKMLCEGELQWHHALIYSGKRQNEKGAILSLCRGHHEKESQFRHLLNQIMYSRMTDEDRAKYPRKKWL